MTGRVLSALLSLLPPAVLALAIVACAPASSPAGTGVLTGRITRGPTTSVARPADAPAPAAGIEIRIEAPDGRPVIAARTDAQGIYRVEVPPGTYRVVTGPLGGMDFTKDLPATVVIARDQEMRLDVRIDTGIR